MSPLGNERALCVNILWIAAYGPSNQLVHVLQQPSHIRGGRHGQLVHNVAERGARRRIGRNQLALAHPAFLHDGQEHVVFDLERMLIRNP
jgi:hypothetical protein